MVERDEEDIEMIRHPLSPAGSSAGSRDKSAGAVPDLHMISEADIEPLKRAVMRAQEEQTDDYPTSFKELLNAAERVLLKGGWADIPAMDASNPQVKPAGTMANSLPAGTILEGYELATDQPGAKKAVNRPGKKAVQETAGSPEESDGEETPSSPPAKPDWSGDNVVLPIELMGVLHDSLLELADQESATDEGPGREALMNLIDHMEDILENVGSSEELTRFLDRQK